MVRVRSEIGRLRTVLVHEPGAEVDRMVPSMMEELLFDDILYGDRAREEHRRFQRVLQLLGVDVVDAETLLAETLETPDARAWLGDVLHGSLRAPDLERFDALPANELARCLIAGARRPESGAAASVDELYAIPPLPNYCFQRDPQIVLADGVVFSAMATDARWREGLLARAIFRFHPDLAATPIILDPLEADSQRALLSALHRPRLEGGDVLVLAPDVVAVGQSERTSELAIEQLALALARSDGGPRWLIVVAIPKRRAYMHLDTVITAVDHDACLVHSSVILEGGGETAEAYSIDLHAADLRPSVRGPVLTALAERGLDLEPIPCGGDDPVAQQREQWTDGANCLALAPGVIALYDRNLATAGALAARGFRLVTGEDLLLGRDELDLDAGERACILLASHEICRARGGPHCLTHPLVRDDA